MKILQWLASNVFIFPSVSLPAFLHRLQIGFLDCEWLADLMQQYGCDKVPVKLGYSDKASSEVLRVF